MAKPTDILQLWLICANFLSILKLELTRLREGKLSEFNPQNNEQVKSSPAHHVCRYERVEITVTFLERSDKFLLSASQSHN